MKPYELKRDGVDIYLEDDGKEKSGLIDGHIHVRSHVFGLDKEDTMNEMIKEIDRLIGILERAKSDLTFMETE